MRKTLAAFLGVLVPMCAFAQTAIWEDAVPNSIAAPPALKLNAGSYRTVRLNKEALAALLAKAPMEFTAAAKSNIVEMTIPMPNGKFARFRIQESPISLPDPSGKTSDFKSYTGQGIDDRTATVRFDISQAGFHAQILSAGEPVFVDPYSAKDTMHCISYYKRDAQKQGSKFECLTPAEWGLARPARQGPVPSTANGATLRKFRTAVAVTGEYTAFFRQGGDTDTQAKARALTAIKTTINRVTGIYERDVAIRLVLLADASELQIIYTNGAIDPYTNSDTDALNTENQTNLDNVIGDANYDIGHVFATAPGGLAGPGPCQTGFKAMGATGTDAPLGDAFNIDYVAHEMGHQFNGTHTFNTNNAGGCVAMNRDPMSAWEPGSGSTILGYTGICDPSDLQANSDDYFHIGTIDQILDYVIFDAGTCSVNTATGNTPPTVTTPASFTIPRNTPFTLTATGSDANGDALTYCWEEFDIGAAAPPNSDSGNRPLFRSYKPVTSRSRTFPSLTYILHNANNPPATFMGTSATGKVCPAGESCLTGEVIPATTRAMKFRVTVRDNRAGGGGINDALTTVNVRADSGPFVVTSPNTAVTATGGAPFTVTWNVANTTAAPVSAANVKISLSTNGGSTFPTVLAASTPNDGSAAVTIPNVATTTARIKVEADGNIFFDISNTNFTISTTTVPPGARGDFNADGSTDYLLFHSGTRRTAIWHLQDNAFLSSIYGPTLPPGWGVNGVADFNLDGRPDYVLLNTNTRQTAIWFISNGTLLNSVYGPTLPSGWTLITVVDFNNDAKPDYVLFNAATRRSAIWFLNGTALDVSAYGPTFPTGWRPVDAQDFNGDGKPDLLLSNSNTRQSAIWYLNGTTHTSSAYGPSLPAGWTLEGTADFDVDGQPDYVLLQTSTRRTAIWYLNGSNLAASAYGPTVAAGYTLVFP